MEGFFRRVFVPQDAKTLRAAADKLTPLATAYQTLKNELLSANRTAFVNLILVYFAMIDLHLH